MSIEYEQYLRNHISNVGISFDWLLEHIPEIGNRLLDNDVNIERLKHCILNHDESKRSKEEYNAYDKYFYGRNRSYWVMKNFDYAWLHHIHSNPHHWQHWILIEDDGKEKILDMPYECIVEMISDWFAFSFKTGNLFEIFNWYDKHKDIIRLSKKTRTEVEWILGEIRKVLEADKG